MTPHRARAHGRALNSLPNLEASATRDLPVLAVRHIIFDKKRLQLFARLARAVLAGACELWACWGGGRGTGERGK